MITVSEPREFIPRGRDTVDYHPGPISKDKPQPSMSAEQQLLERMQNISISQTNQKPSEFYSLREAIVKDATDGPKGNQLMPYTCTEEELYVRGHIAVWTRSVGNEPVGMPYTSFSIARPIKYAFFCPFRFLEPDTMPAGKVLNRNAICLVDHEVLQVYCDNGETYGAEIECPISAIWPTPVGVLLEKDPTRSRVLDSCSLPMPRIFTLSYPTAEMKPVLVNTVTEVGYITEPELRVVFACEQVELILLYDQKTRKHFICWLRHATDLERMMAQVVDPEDMDDSNSSENGSFGEADGTIWNVPDKPPTFMSLAPFELNRDVVGGDNVKYANNMSPGVKAKLSSAGSSFLQSIGFISKVPSMLNEEEFDTPLNLPRFDVAGPSKPIVPEYCLQHLWTDDAVPSCSRKETGSRSYLTHGEMASVGFFHIDLVGCRYVCYLQPGANKLTLVQHEMKTESPAIVACHSIPACSAVSLERLNLIVLLDPTGKLMLYSGPLNVGKVHVSGLLSSCFQSSGAFSSSTSASSGSVSQHRVTWKRSSLLPNAVASDSNKFEDELHRLSPVRASGAMAGSGGSLPLDLQLRDGTGTRFTLAFDGGVTIGGSGKSFRVTLPPLAESQLVLRCLEVLRRVLPEQTAHQFLSRWYGTRNVPGSHDGFSVRQEWNLFQTLLFSEMGRPIVSTDATTKVSQERPPAFRPTPRRSVTTEGGGSGCSEHGTGWSADEPKKRRRDDNTHGKDCDWEFLQQNVTVEPAPAAPSEPSGAAANASGGLGACRPYKARDPLSLYRHIPEILQTLHLLYEDFKLDTGLTDELRLLGEFLFSLATDGQVSRYQQHYFQDFPELCDRYRPTVCRITDSCLLNELHFNSLRRANIYRYMQTIVQGMPETSGLQEDSDPQAVVPYPHLAGINDRSRDVILLMAFIYRERRLSKWVAEQLSAILAPDRFERQLAKPLVLSAGAHPSKSDRFGNTLLHFLIERGYKRVMLDDFPVAVRFLVLQALEPFREYTMHGHDAAVYDLLLRPELHQHAVSSGIARNSFRRGKPRIINRARRNEQLDQWLSDVAEVDPMTGLVLAKDDPQRIEREDGMDNLDLEVLRLRFPYDRRMENVRSFLGSSMRVTIDIPQGPQVSDHDFIEEQERRLYSLCLRTMALPIGRGMFTLSTSSPVATQTAPVPRLCLTGCEPLRGTTIEILQLEVPPHMNLWPSFHNGVAAGLRISPDAPNITSSWITNNRNSNKRSNRTAGNGCPFGPGTEASIEHGGFLLALGLTGHLSQMSPYTIFDYMVRSNEMVRLGLLLGLAAAQRGTEHVKTTRLLAVHVEALLPPTALELDVTQNLQVAALVGIGLVYQCTAKRHVAEVLLQEIGRPPGPEMENSVERESYALAAGLALGLVTLGRGDQLSGLRDLAIPGELYHYMNGGNRRMAVGAQREKYKLPSFQIREGDCVNLDVTAPGATLALGLMFFGTGDATIAGWLQPPHTKYLFGFVRPDMLLLRIIARHLICWDDVQPTTAWVQGQLPPILMETVEIVEGRRSEVPTYFPSLQPQMSQAERELYCQAYCAIVCGSAIGIGLRFAGTADPIAAKTLDHYLRYFITLRHPKPSPDQPDGALAQLVGSQITENCVLMTLLALSLVLAGTGDRRILRTVRMLRSRAGVPGVTYGSHMAVHMALGFAFLGAGRYTLSRSPPAIAALVCALFPKFPIYSNDNRYHLQALRHLYVLAVEPRLFVPRRVDTGQLTMCNIRYAVRTTGPNGQTFEHVETQMSPWMLPELHTLAWLEVCDENFYIVRFDKRNWKMLETILRSRGFVDVLQHVGCLSYLDDPTRVITMRMDNLPGKDNSSWQFEAEQLLELASQPTVIDLTQKLLLPPKYYMPRAAIEPTQCSQFAIRALFYFKKMVAECVMKDRMHAMSITFDVTEMLLDQDYKERFPSNMRQMQLLRATLSNRIPMLRGSGRLLPGPLIRSLVLRVCGDWTKNFNLHRPVLQHLCGVFSSANTPLHERLRALPVAMDENEEGVELFTGSIHADWRSHILTNVARIAAMHELPVDVISLDRLNRFWPQGKPTRMEFFITLATYLPGLPLTTISCLANILNLS